MIAFQKIQKQKQLKRNSVDNTLKQKQPSSIVLEGSNYRYKSKDAFLEEKTLQDQKTIANNLSQEKIKSTKNQHKNHKFEEMKVLNLEKVQQQNQKQFAEEDSNSLRKNQKNIIWKDLLNLSLNINGNESSRIQNRIKTPQWRVTRFHGFQTFNKSLEQYNDQHLNLSINSINQGNGFQKQSLSPSPELDNNTQLHSQHQNKSNNENLIFVRRIQTPNKFLKPQLKSPNKYNKDKQEVIIFQNEILQKNTFLLQNQDLSKSYLPQIKIDKQKRELRQKEIQDKMRQYFVKNQIKLKQENDSFIYDKYTIRGLSVTPQQKQQSLANQF
ncbi:hypothetical protein TTHERM_00486960 (macronuclear) [Tetrahymena thermophila SB210]|uniref:Uncharacterized protein n=1 Tax=Tetrahymena thermophila (strain SB210) TaxID=312017 RepID=I7MGK1_TETTS|nr:hypothetical protein TTHERM_00486960 [Tetrahymena thermophila SB210]EAR85245.1 hypothetical protein TTHERM_00486960 [Tetrahymena thermophila SB210]|eukprot:XP_001032908.1 hypothetical protein TTHERM_00486960 [Tetrahymena thermophila SB210]